MPSYVEEFVAFLGWEVDNTELKKFEKNVDDLGNMLKKATAFVAGAAASLTALTAVVNQTTAANTALAKSVGVSSDFLEALNGAIAPLGFELDNVVDLVEEMNNKFGESKGLGKPMTAVTEATRILGLEFKKIKDLAPEEQFVQILEAAKNLEDQQAAVSAVDILMGGEANKILGFLRTQDESLLQLIQRQMQLNMLTEEGRAGAERFNNTFIELKTVVNSAKQEFFGLVGEALSPLLEEYADWLAANNELVKSKIAEWAREIGRALGWVMSIAAWLIGRVGEVVTALGGMEKVLKLTSVALLSIFGTKMMLAIGAFIKMMKVAGTEAFIMNLKAALIPATIAAIIALFILLGEDLYHFFTGGESALGKLGDIIAEFVHSNIRPSIANFLGMTPEELDAAFLDAIDAVIGFWEGTVHYASIAIEKTIDFVVLLVQAINTSFKGLMKLGEHIGDAMARMVIAIKLFFMDVGTFADNTIQIFTKLVDGFVLFVSTIPDSLMAMVQKTVSGISSIVRSIPFVGGLFGGETPAEATEGGRGAPTRRTRPIQRPFVEQGPTAPVEPGRTFADGLDQLARPQTPAPSQGVRTAITNANQTRTVNQSNQFSNEFNITQLPGESGEALASRVADEIQRASARAVSANDSGIEI